MMVSLFSPFDPMSSLDLFLISSLTLMLLIVSSSLQPLSVVSISVAQGYSLMVQSFAPTFYARSFTLLSVPGFFVLYILNISGLISYSFGLTASLFFTVSAAFALWVLSVIVSLNPSPYLFISHLVPLGCPGALSPFLVLVETVSHLIRPLTLSVRLIANLVAGHLLLSLAVGPFSILSPMTSLLLLPQFILVCLELAVALVQAYVFFNLLSLYSTAYRVSFSITAFKFVLSKVFYSSICIGPSDFVSWTLSTVFFTGCPERASATPIMISISLGLLHWVASPEPDFNSWPTRFLESTPQKSSALIMMSTRSHPSR